MWQVIRHWSKDKTELNGDNKKTVSEVLKWAQLCFTGQIDEEAWTCDGAKYDFNSNNSNIKEWHDEWINNIYKKYYDENDSTLRDKQYKGKIFIFRNDESHQPIVFMKIDDKSTPRIPTVELQLKKENFNGSRLADAEIKIKGANNVKSISDAKEVTLKSAGIDGGFGKIRITPEENNGEFTLNITETTAPEGYNKLEKPITLKIKYDKNNGDIEEVIPSDSNNVEFSDKTVVLKNTPKRLEYKIIKTDDNGTKLKSAKFKVSFSCPGCSQNIDSIEVTTDKNGETQILDEESTKKIFEHFKICDELLYKQIAIAITIEETEPPEGYLKLEEPIKFVVMVNDEKLSNYGLADINKNYCSAIVDDSKITIKNNELPNYKILKVAKEDNNKKLSNAEFGVKIAIDGTQYEEYTVKTDDQGETQILSEEIQKAIIEKYEQTLSAVNLKVELRETKAPTGYITDTSIKEMNLIYDGNKIVDETNGNSRVITNNKKMPAEIIIEKQDETGNKIEGVEFSGIIVGAEKIESISSGTLKKEKTELSNIIKLENIKTNKDGQIKISKIHSELDVMYLALKETSVEDAVSTKLKEKYLLEKLNFNKDKNTWEVSILDENNKEEMAEMAICAGIINNYMTIDDKEVMKIDSDFTIEKETNSIKLIIKNESVLHQFELTKRDSSTGQILPNIKFKIEITNVKSATINGKNTIAENSTIETEAVTDKNGKIIFNDIILSDQFNIFGIRITELEANGYKKYQDSINITLTKTSEGFKLSKIPYTLNGENGEFDPVTKGESISNEEFNVNNDVNITTIGKEQTLSLNLRNISSIDLEGTVWKDGQQGIKDVSGPNGEKDENEERIQGIKVYLYNADTNGNRVGEAIRNTITDANGKYEFKELPKTANGYIIGFEYNGVTHQETNSAYTDNTRTDSKAAENLEERNDLNSKFNTITSSGASRANETEKTIPLSYTYNNGESKLNSSIDGSNPANRNEKDFAINAYTGVYKETTRDIDCGLVERGTDLAIGTDIESAKLTINDKEKTYDYAQIMSGEMEDLTLDNNLQDISSSKTNVVYNLYLDYSDYNYRISDYKTGDNAISNQQNQEDNQVNNYDGLKKLEAYVTYSVILKNQSTYDAKIDEFVYYYDEIYEPFEVKETDKYYVSIDGNQRKITFRSKGDGLSVNAPNYRAIVEITFKIKEDANGSLLTKDNCTNIAEITKYSTTSGVIDNDSAPGNGITNGKITKPEDDTDESKEIKISIRQDAREITGTVFDDRNKDGKNNDSTPVNDVIVQLIEIKKIGNANYEYIWQETRSGSNTVRTTDRNEHTEIGYTNDVTAESGQYKFKDFIAGDYIVRFIYGDGRVYDITNSVKQYNGQDYQSTIDEKYQEPWYNAANYKDKNASVARDNEARRLKVMSYSTTINNDMWKSLENNFDDINKVKENLQNTWMCAETSKVNVDIDSNEPINNMNFGLKLRPQTKLELEKHITALKITPSGVGVQPIVDAKADISQILGDTNITTQGIKNGLATLKSTRDERGWWKVETDIEELAQGATLEVEYTYVLKNNSDEDYLSENLVKEYRDNIGKDADNNSKDDYVDYLTGASSEVKGRAKGNTDEYGKYLGHFYYTGVKVDSDAPVLSRVDTIEEALNNNLKFSETSGTDFKNNGNATKSMYDTDGNIKNDVAIETVIINTKPTGFLAKDGVDMSKKASLNTVLSASSTEISYPSYIAEIVQYSNAAGRRDMDATPGNLSYVHSEDTRMTLNAYKYTDPADKKTVYGETLPSGAENVVKLNEADEFWGERILVSKPTGEDKITGVQITIITISSIAVIGVGIVLIKKFALKK